MRDAFDEAVAIARRMDRPDLLARAALGFGVGLGAFEVRLLDHRQIDLLEEAAAALDVSSIRSSRWCWPACRWRWPSSTPTSAGPSSPSAPSTSPAPPGESVALGHALAARCDAFAGPDHTADRLAAAGEIVTLAQRAGDLPLELLGRRLRVVALFESLQLARGRPRDRRLRADRRCAR